MLRGRKLPRLTFVVLALVGAAVILVWKAIPPRDGYVTSLRVTDANRHIVGRALEFDLPDAIRVERCCVVSGKDAGVCACVLLGPEDFAGIAGRLKYPYQIEDTESFARFNEPALKWWPLERTNVQRIFRSENSWSFVIVVTNQTETRAYVYGAPGKFQPEFWKLL